MEIIIGILIIYGIVKLIIFLAPYIGTFLLFVLVVGSVAGLIVGVFFGIKNYILSINENISNKAFKNMMMVITSVIIIMILFYLIAIVNFLYSYTH